MSETKDLAIGAVLTITTGIVMVEGFAGVHEAFEWIMGHPVWTHEMPKYGKAAKELVLRQHPAIPTDAGPDWRATLADAVDRFSETIAVERGGEVRDTDPISSAIDAISEARK